MEVEHVPIAAMNNESFENLANSIKLFGCISKGKRDFETPSGSDGKESACNTGDLGSISGLRRSPGAENRNPLQYSCLENSMDRGYSPCDHRVRHDCVTNTFIFT